MALKIFTKIVTRYNEISEDINNWLATTYNKAGILFNSASPYGQLLTVFKELYYMNILNIKNILSQLDIDYTNNSKVIRTLARIAGHNPSRPISATGILNFKIKPNIEIDTIPNINIKNNTILKNKTNSLYYSMMMGSENVVYNINKETTFFMNIIQGKFQWEYFTGTGTNNQSVSINIEESKHIENFNVEVYYNGEKLENKKHLFDMNKGEKACYIRSGFSGGIDIYFGTSYFGFKPEIGSTISVKYLLTDGSEGNIFNKKINDWVFVDSVFSKNGELVEMEELFNISMHTDIDFSSDGESAEYTKRIIPYVSRNFVLATKEQFIYHLKRLNMFSKINIFTKEVDNTKLNDTRITDRINILTRAVNKEEPKESLLTHIANVKQAFHDYKYTKDNTIYLDLIPKLDLYLNSYTNYFNMSMDAFILSDNMKNKIINYLKQEGIMNMTSDIDVITPKINKFISYIYIRKYKGHSEEDIKNKVINSLSDFLINYERYDRIVRADVIKLLKTIEGIDSVDVFFVSKENEDLHKLNPNSKNVVGIDPIMGDIIMKNGELCILRGGWKDRNDVYYSDGIDSKSSMNSVNIIFNGITDTV